MLEVRSLVHSNEGEINIIINKLPKYMENNVKPAAEARYSQPIN